MPSFSETVPTTTTLPAEALVRCLRDARAHTLALVEDLTDEQLIGPRLATVNPLLWEIGHLAWFHESFILRGRSDEHTSELQSLMRISYAVICLKQQSKLY